MEEVHICTNTFFIPSAQLQKKCTILSHVVITVSHGTLHSILLLNDSDWVVRLFFSWWVMNAHVYILYKSNTGMQWINFNLSRRSGPLSSVDIFAILATYKLLKLHSIFSR
jgi:hypothetical protein